MKEQINRKDKKNKSKQCVNKLKSKNCCEGGNWRGRGVGTRVISPRFRDVIFTPPQSYLVELLLATMIRCSAQTRSVVITKWSGWPVREQVRTRAPVAAPSRVTFPCPRSVWQLFAGLPVETQMQSIPAARASFTPLR